MKVLFITALLSCCWWGARAQKNNTMEAKEKDSLEISRVLEEVYFQGIYTGDVKALRTIYNPGTLLFGDVKGQPYAKTLDQYLDGVAGRQSPKESGKPFKGEIVNIRVTNSIAAAEVKVKMYDFNYHEYLSFHKIDGKWLLVNKMISDESNAISDSSFLKTATKTTVVAYINILPGFEKEVKGAMMTMAAESNKEPGCEKFLAYTRNDAPQKIVIYEVYKNDGMFQLHKATAHAAAFFAFVKGKIADDKIEAVLLTGLGDPR